MSQKKEKVWTYEEISSPHIMFFKIFGLVPLEKKLFNFIDAKFLRMEPIEFYLILTACGYLRSLQTRLILMSEGQNEINTNSKENPYTIELMYHEIVKCAKFHQSIMLYSEEVEDFMRSIYFVCVATNIYNISFVGISLLKETDEQSVKWFILLIWNIAQFYTYQWSPEYLLTESEAIVYGAYHLRSKLIGQHRKSDKILHFLIMRAQKPIQLTAGGYIKLSLETFTNMIKSAISLFTLLRTFDI
ncbi:PREDICTED: odorant receptor 13a-like [Ceratosolen solmsi marchali]|uniref:Odorant receptor 13a-like n=1 Tax=Ceratosolen solmsi marchali TaxID=326594 RepID=A0AAJ6YPD8_9HYME|nr:PREDICTED: odorant receptor 13a-like [Ceratosolen solmsi marchali]